MRTILLVAVLGYQVLHNIDHRSTMLDPTDSLVGPKMRTNQY